MKLLAELVDRTPDAALLQQHLARAYLNLGTVIPAQERFADAKEANDRAIAILLALAEKFPDNPDYRHELGVAYNNLGNLFARTERPDDANGMYVQALERFAPWLTIFPKCLRTGRNLPTRTTASAASGSCAGLRRRHGSLGTSSVVARRTRQRTRRRRRLSR